MRAVWWILGVVVAAGAAVGIYEYMDYREHHPATDDAYVQADVVSITPQAGGQVISLTVEDQAEVHQGQPLFTVDPKPYQLRVEQAKARLEQVGQGVQAARVQVDAAKAELSMRLAQLHNVELRAERIHNLRQKNTVSQSTADDIDEALKSAQAAVTLAQAHSQQARVQLGAAGEQNEKIREARTAYEGAMLDLSHTQVNAPCSGRIANLKLQVAEVVQPGRPLFSVVCTEHFWVYANFKETELKRIRPGQQATITVDMYPGQTFHGVVQNIGVGTGTAFSMLPPENATGNWVKVTQRVPVRILITDPKQDYPLRVQTSAMVTLDTGNDEQPVGYAYNHAGITAPAQSADSIPAQPSAQSAVGRPGQTPG